MGKNLGYDAANKQASFGGDLISIGKGMILGIGSVAFSGYSDQIGPFDELALKNNYQLLLKDQGRWAEAGYVEGMDWAMTQRLMWSGIAVGEAGGLVGSQITNTIRNSIKNASVESGAFATRLSAASADADSEAGVGRARGGTLLGEPEAPPANAPADQVRSIDRQNEAARKLAEAGYDVEQLPNDKKNQANPDLRLNGELADVYSPKTSSAISAIKTITEKVKKQADVIVVNLADSALTIDQLDVALKSNPVDGLKKIYIMKDHQFKITEF
ncbi:hypothetical protein M0D46_07490 [Xanthomonas prunicola]|uniref:CdiA C-terminal domain-containing protein n=1 Tax=Xanthomonas prunicola TaxID=2053930 RepID=UPI0021B31ABB|nr:hypothetical protein [Xanthomonas prunicola]UXA70859.1 hypothetical protein M0D46_07490 [Xanthomonas prunicola]